MAPWIVVLIGLVLIWAGLKNKATDLVNALLDSASPFNGASSASAGNNGSAGDNQGAPAATGSGTVAA